MATSFESRKCCDDRRHDRGVPAPSGAHAGFAEGDTPDYSTSLLSTSDGLALAKAFMRIENSKLRRRIVDLVEEMAGGRTA